MPKILLKPKPNFDLLRKNPRPVLLELKETKINVEVEIETKAPNSAKTDRWTKVAEGEMERYREIVEDTVEKVVTKWDVVDKATKLPMSKSEREKQAKDLITSVNNACASMEAAIEKAVKEQIKREAQGDKNLLEARIAVAVKGTFKIIAIGKDVAELAVSGGANVKAWYSLAKDIYTLAKLINDQCKDEPALRDDLLKAIGTYCSTKQRRFDEAQKAADWKAQAKLKIKEIWTSQKSLAAKCETQRKSYRNEVTVLIQHVDKLGGKRDDLQVEMKKTAKLDAEGIKAGKKLVDLGSSVKSMNTLILKSQAFVDDMAFLLTENGIEVDDRTAMQKLKALDDLGSIKTAAKEIYTAATDLQTIIEAIKG
ncbi:MAG TPA: hypothetical protein VGM81_20715 [Burkholderiaceae bacterium]|jgi:hypothetical protein